MSTATVSDPVSLVPADSASELPPLSGATKMGALLESYPGAQRALFAKYHIGGCRSCGFQPGETLAEVCARNENIPVEEAVAHIQESYQSDASLQITPTALVALREANPNTKVLDVRSREEHEAVSIPGSLLVSQELIQEVFDTWSKLDPLVIYDHQGNSAMDAAAYFLGHGFVETKCLKGGIDGYSLEVDPSIIVLAFTIKAWQWMPTVLFVSYLAYGLVRPWVSRKWRREIEDTAESENDTEGDSNTFNSEAEAVARVESDK